MKIKIYKEDKLFSAYIKRRDLFQCKRCGTAYLPDRARGLTCSHFWSRRHWNTRFDPENADCLCFGCHVHVESEKHGWYKDFKLKQLGEKRYKNLEIRAKISGVKRDRKLAFVYVMGLLKSLDEQKN